MMTMTRTLAVAVAMILSTSTLYGQAKSHYRDFLLGSTLVSVSGQVNVAASDAKVIHQRPALIQSLQWRSSYFQAGSNEPLNDPVQQILFSFYNDQLFRMAIDYDRQRTDGMTEADMIGALSATYGGVLKLAPRTAQTFVSQIDDVSGTPIARWGDADFSLVLLRSTFGQGFRLVVTSTRLDALARTADTEAVRLDAREAPQREIARQKKEADDARALQEKARVANKASFRP